MAFTEVSDLLHSMLRIYMSTMLKNVRMNTVSLGNGSVFIWCETLILSLALRRKKSSNLQRTRCQRSSLNTVLLFTITVSCKFFCPIYTTRNTFIIYKANTTHHTHHSYSYHAFDASEYPFNVFLVSSPS